MGNSNLKKVKVKVYPSKSFDHGSFRMEVKAFTVLPRGADVELVILMKDY